MKRKAQGLESLYLLHNQVANYIPRVNQSCKDTPDKTQFLKLQIIFFIEFLKVWFSTNYLRVTQVFIKIVDSQEVPQVSFLRISWGVSQESAFFNQLSTTHHESLKITTLKVGQKVILSIKKSEMWNNMRPHGLLWKEKQNHIVLESESQRHLGGH